MQDFLARLFEAKANGPQIAALLVKLLGVKLSETTLVSGIEEHPSFPSLLSISDVLNRYGIDNIGIRFENEKISQIPLPFITQIRGQTGEGRFFTIVSKSGNGNVKFFDPESHKWSLIDEDKFLERCSNVALIAQANELAGEKEYEKIQKKEKIGSAIRYIKILSLPIIIVASAFSSLLYDGLVAMLPFLYLIITLAGVLAATLLQWYELDQHNPILQQICHSGKKVNCGAVLQSKYSKIFGVSWSTIGLSYFTGLVLMLLFWGIGSKSSLVIAAYINILVAPYIVFSILYQWKIAKQWCVMCLSVQGILLLQITIAILGNWYSLTEISYRPELSFQILAAFMLPFFLIILVLPTLKKAKESKRLHTQLQRLKHSPQIFDALLKRQKELTESAEGLGIKIGNPEAKYKVIKVCNPYCGPCANAHKPMEELLDNNSDVQIQILFTATTLEGDIKAAPVKHLLAIAEDNDETITKRALDDWYVEENRNYVNFASKYPLNKNLDLQAGRLEAMHSWCEKVKVDFTPTFYISMPNDQKGESERYYQLPDIYTVSDLKHFLLI
ncbi:vitamin K epoxide reductase family protein [Dyadobacter alkalitolerans]|uniref:vitamin K epoxide reductase family protein n=1 Tax=Dyadobacter alkalitolerans TaxID=492736 RepID=UPI00042180AF|nr:vitamin K epoxide reductase family protein [Dyadobacter alkalitolerans]